MREIRDFAKLQNDAGETIAHAEAGMKEKAQEFREKGGKLYPEKVGWSSSRFLPRHS